MAYSNMPINKRGNIKKTYGSAEMEDLSSEKEVCRFFDGQRCNIDDEPDEQFQSFDPIVSKPTTMTPVSNLHCESDGARRLGQGIPFTSDEPNISKEYNQVKNTEGANFEEGGTVKQKVVIPNKDDDDSVPNPKPMTKPGELVSKSGDIICSKEASARNLRGTHIQGLIEYPVNKLLKLEEHPKRPKPKRKNVLKKTKCVDNDKTAACPTDGQEHSYCNTKRDSVDAVTPEQDQVSFQTAVVAEDASIQTVTGIDNVSVHTAAVTEQVSAHSTAHSSCNTKRDSVNVVSLADLGTPEQYTIKSSAGDKCIQITKKLQAPDRSEHAVEQVSPVQAKAFVQYLIPFETVQVHSADIEEDSSGQTTAIIYVTVQTATTTTEQFSAQATATQDQVSFQTTIVTEDASIQTVTGIDNVSVHTPAVSEQVSSQTTAAQDQVSFQTTIVTEDVSNQTVTGIDNVSVHTAAVSEQVSSHSTAAVDQISYQTTIVTEDASIQTVTGIDNVSVHTAAVSEQVSSHSTAAVDQILFYTAVVTEDVSIQTATTIHDVSVHTAEATDVIEQVPVQTVLVTDVSVHSADVKEKMSELTPAVTDCVSSLQTEASATPLSLQQTRSEPFNDGAKTSSAEGPEELQTDQDKRHHAVNHACESADSGMDPQQPLRPFGQQDSSSNSSSHHVLPQQTFESPERSGFPQELSEAPASSCTAKDTVTSEPSRHTEANAENVQQCSQPCIAAQNARPLTQIDQRIPADQRVGHQEPRVIDPDLGLEAVENQTTPRHLEIHTSEELLRHVQLRGSVSVHLTQPEQSYPNNNPVDLGASVIEGSVRLRSRRPHRDLGSFAVDLQDTRDLPEDWAADVDVRQPGPRQSGLPQTIRGASGLRIQNPDWMTSDISADERGRLPSQLRHLLAHELMATLSQDLGSRRGPVVVTCVVCSSRPVSILTFNCTHRVVCIVCFLQRRLRRCPLLWCQRPILFYLGSGSP